MNDPQRIVVYFDGVCNLCNRAVDFIIRHDVEGRIRFASLQSESGQRALSELGLESEALKTVILEVDGVFHQKSDAALNIASMLDRPVRWLACFRPLPRCVRDSMYMFISNNRYRWFGKKSSCRLPVGDEAKRFID